MSLLGLPRSLPFHGISYASLSCRYMDAYGADLCCGRHIFIRWSRGRVGVHRGDGAVWRSIRAIIAIQKSPSRSSTPDNEGTVTSLRNGLMGDMRP